MINHYEIVENSSMFGFKFTAIIYFSERNDANYQTHNCNTKEEAEEWIFEQISDDE